MDYWAARVPVSRVIIELKGEIHEQIVRDAFRVAAAKLPGTLPLAPNPTISTDTSRLQATTRPSRRATRPASASPSSPQITCKGFWLGKELR
jgi:hypothetical protein